MRRIRIRSTYVVSSSRLSANSQLEERNSSTTWAAKRSRGAAVNHPPTLHHAAQTADSSSYPAGPRQQRVWLWFTEACRLRKQKDSGGRSHGSILYWWSTWMRNRKQEGGRRTPLRYGKSLCSESIAVNKTHPLPALCYSLGFGFTSPEDSNFHNKCLWRKRRVSSLLLNEVITCARPTKTGSWFQRWLNTLGVGITGSTAS